LSDAHRYLRARHSEETDTQEHLSTMILHL
jgi:hypothetical protein